MASVEPFTYDHGGLHIVRAAHIEDMVGAFEKELAGLGHAIVHDKIVVVDPLSDNCIVAAGSHNLGFKASYENDENLMIVTGAKALAQAYAVHVLDVYDHYRFRAWQAEAAAHGKPTFQGHIQGDDKWLGQLTKGPRRDLSTYFAYGLASSTIHPGGGAMSDFATANEKYETWLRAKCQVVEADLEFKHRKRMTESAFAFLRATYFRWAEQVGAACAGLNSGPSVLCVGDLHTENFGTWRDGDGRLVWGVNDFDEADVMPYAFDLVRLATSAALALPASRREAAAAILAGYRQGLNGPGSTLVYQSAQWMLPLVASGGKHFFIKLSDPSEYPPAIPPQEVASTLIARLPAGATLPRYATRRKGGGGLGRPRYLAIGSWQGGSVVREAKAWVPSAWGYIHGREATQSAYLDLARGPHRSPDPFLDIAVRFIFRRIAPDSDKIDLGENPEAVLSDEMLQAMGRDIASIHARDATAVAKLKQDLEGRPAGWLSEATKKMEGLVQADFESWARLRH